MNSLENAAWKVTRKVVRKVVQKLYEELHEKLHEKLHEMLHEKLYGEMHEKSYTKKLHESIYFKIYLPTTELSHQLTSTYWSWLTYKMLSSRNISREWLRKEAIFHLELYHVFPLLLNVHSSDYKKRNMRIIFLRKIQEWLSTTIPLITIEDINEKLHKFQTQYQKERTKIRWSSRIGLGLDKPMLWFYKKMSF